MEYSRRIENGYYENQNTVLITRSAIVVEAFNPLGPTVVTSPDDIGRRLEPKAIILDRESACPGRIYHSSVNMCTF
jgi:hypothetical protein